MADITLHQFVSSHFNDKARWALAFKGLAHDRVDYLPGPHASTISKLSGGSRQTPLLQTPDGYISDSAKIIDYLERTYPEPPLYPSDHAQREEALAVQAHFDSVVGPAARSAVFSVFLKELDYMVQTFGYGKSRLKLLGYRAVLPLVVPTISKANGVDTQENIEKAFSICSRTLDEVASKTEATDFMVGDHFTVADLATAALLCPLVLVEHPDMVRRTPMPERFATFIDRWKDHPAAKWVQRKYAENRPS